ncbi:MAG: hypothetical protein PVH31_08720 [Ectothiorhodospiraceae bacterium]|jgi:hypothetical protein
MPRHLIHIGYHKTATTWFQKRYYPNVANVAYVPRNTVQEAFLEPSAFRFDPAAARARLAEYEREDAEWAVLCEEELSGNVHSGGMLGCQSRDVAQRLKRTFGDAEIVIFLRNQVDMTAALYAHYIREGGTHRPERYLFPERFRKDVARHRFKYPLFSFDHLDYAGLVRYYRELFGASHVHVFLFEAFRDDPAAFVADYSARFGLASGGPEPGDNAENAGFALRALTLARWLNHFTYRSVLDKRVVARLLSNKLRSDLPRMMNRSRFRGGVASPQRLLRPETIDTIRRRFTEGNRWLMDELGLPLAEFGYPY